MTGTRALHVAQDGSGVRRLTFNDIVERQPVWSPTVLRSPFAGFREGNWEIYSIAADGSDLRRHTTDTARDDYPKWTADGRIVFRGPFDCSADDPCRAWIVGSTSASATRLPLEGNVLDPEPSPHGLRIAYASPRDGQWSIYVSNFDSRAVKRVTDPGSSAFGDFNPLVTQQRRPRVSRDVTGDDNDLYVVHADGTELRRVTDTPDRLEFVSWVPDGTEVMVTTGEGPQRIVAIRLADGAERRWARHPEAPFVETFGDGIRDASLWRRILDSEASVGESGGSTRDGDPRKRDAGRPVEPGRGALGAAMHGRRHLRCPGRLRAAQWPPRRVPRRAERDLREREHRAAQRPLGSRRRDDLVGQAELGPTI